MLGTTSEFLAAYRESVLPDHLFESHSHAADQLAWIPGGAEVRVAESRWQVRGDQFVWIPALADHEIQMTGAEETFSLYIDPRLRLRQERWDRPLVLPVDPVAGAIVLSLCTTRAAEGRLQASLNLLTEILMNTVESYDMLTLPTDTRARAVAEAVLKGPGETHSLASWAENLNVSTKTLLRAFRTDTGLTYAQWRTRARIYAAERLLAEGLSVQETSELSGYSTSTGFIKAFRSVFGATPATYARAKRGPRRQAPRRTVRTGDDVISATTTGDR